MTRDLFQEVKLDPAGVERAREVAQWEIGDPAWADVIVRAYFLPTPEWQEAHKGIHGVAAENEAESSTTPTEGGNA